ERRRARAAPAGVEALRGGVGVVDHPTGGDLVGDAAGVVALWIDEATAGGVVGDVAGRDRPLAHGGLCPPPGALAREPGRGGRSRRGRARGYSLPASRFRAMTMRWIWLVPS